ncbi:MAG: M13 family metallopeptidase [Bacteroidales bacterium]|nr:M13 family metallopeptidase [Bacteroidales bacterium]
MKKTLISIACLAFFASCSNNKKMDGLDLTNLDMSISPTEDFYQFATGGWQANNPIPDEYARFGSFDKLALDNQIIVRQLIEDLSKKNNADGSNAQKIGTLFALGMDTVRLDRDGIAPILNDIEKIKGLATSGEMIAYIVEQHTQGTSSPLFSLYAAADLDNSNMNIAWVNQVRLGMGDRDYYLEHNERNLALREAYKTYVQTTFELSGFSQEESQKMATDVMKVETKLAEITMPRIEMRDPHKTFNKMNVEKLQTLTPIINWRAYFDDLGLNHVDELSVRTVGYFSNLSRVLSSLSADELRNYLLCDYIGDAAPYLSTPFQDARFEYFGRALRGTQAQEERWKTMVNVVNGVLGEAVGEEYVKIYFPPAAKARMMDLVKNLLSAFGERINHLEWMSDETKEKAQEKLGTFRVKIGYPDKWRDYSDLTINPEDSYFENIKRASKFQHDFMLSEINQPVDIDKWLMNAHTVNAYYMATNNEICFPAGILQPPFFFMNGDDALNYGAIGMVIAHEISHGFDDQGRKYDKDGNLTDWWTAEDAERFGERTKVLVDHFDGIEVAPGTFANGTLTLGENIADNGGLQAAYTGFMKTKQYQESVLLQDFTPSQRFFIAYATVWASNIREAEILRQTKEGVHSLPRNRVNGTVPHIDAFVNAFNVKPGDGMWLVPEKRAKVW